MKTKPTIKDLYIANLSFEVEEEELLKLFSICGTVRKIHMITDAKSGQSKGCAFVHMATAAEANDAITTLDGTRLVDRCINVTAALPRKTTPPAEKAVEEKPRQTQRTASADKTVKERPRQTPRATPAAKAAEEKSWRTPRTASADKTVKERPRQTPRATPAAKETEEKSWQTRRPPTRRK